MPEKDKDKKEKKLPAKRSETLVAKRNDIIQNSRYSLSLLEAKIVNYSLTKVKPTDTAETEYTFDFHEFCVMTGAKSESYTYLKRVLKQLSDKSMWIRTPDGGETLIRWYNHVDIDPGKTKVTVTFHDRITPYINNLIEQKEKDGFYYTVFDFKQIGRMSNRYSPRLYEILKSYSYNNNKWQFEIGTGGEHDLHLLMCNYNAKEERIVVPERWKNFSNFRRSVLEPAIKEINEYSDLNIGYTTSHYDLAKNKYHAIASVTFFMVDKTEGELNDIEWSASTEREDEEYRQMTLEEAFVIEHEKKLESEKEERIEKSFLPNLTALFYEFSDEEIKRLYTAALFTEKNNYSVTDYKDKEMWACEYIGYYYKKLNKSQIKTKTTRFERLLDLVRNDYDDVIMTFEYWVKDPENR